MGLGGDAMGGVRDGDAAPYGVDTIRLRISFPAAPVSQGYNGRAWKMRPLRGWTGGQAAGREGFIAGEGVSAEAPEFARSDTGNLFAGPGAPADPADPADDPGQSSEVDAGQYSRSRPGYHDYRVNDVVASAAEVSEDGLTVVNRTIPGHLLADGSVVRTAIHNPDGSWSVKTIGLGNNVYPELAPVNEFLGPYIFTNLDLQMRRNIQRHHGAP